MNERPVAATAPPPLLPTADVMRGSEHSDRVADKLRRRDARHDAWTSEVLSEQITTQLDRLRGCVEQRDFDAVAVVADPSFQCAPLRPPLVKAYETPRLRVMRQLETADNAGQVDSGQQSGPQRLAEAIQEIWPDRIAGVDPHVKFKLVQIDMGADEEVSSTILYHGHVDSDDNATEQTATWHCRWRKFANDDTVKLASIRVQEFEEVVSSGGPLFEEVTTAILGQTIGYTQQLRFGTDYWRSRIQATLGQDLFGHYGVAIGDANGDGLDDLYVCQPGGLPNRLFQQQADGTAIDVSAASQTDLLDSTNSAMLVDMDNDGDQDLVALTAHTLYYFVNDGDGVFATQVAVPIRSKNALAMAVADYDGDSFLDVYVCGYAYPTGGARVPRPYHDANNGYPNRMLRNRDGTQLEDVTEQVGLDENNRRYSFAASFEDFDNDGDLDLYVANDYGRNNLYRNDAGQFRDLAAAAGVEDVSAGMAVTWGDYNRDGWMDVHVSNMFSSAGNRVTYQRNFRSNEDQNVRSLYQRHARGNSLFANRQDGTFQDVSVEAGITMGRWAWGAMFVDANNDGWQDLVVANGNITGTDTDDL